MRKLHIVGLALFAVFAFMAVSAAGASAAEWLVDGAALSAAESVDSEATLQLSDATLFGTIKLQCSGTDEGTVGPGAADKTNVIENLAKTSKTVICTVIEGGGLCTEPATAEAVHLPWATTLESTTADDLTSSGAGNPGWFVKCANGLTDECTKALATLAIKNNANGTTEATFNAAENATCKNGTGKVSGTVINLTLTGLTLAVS